MFQWIKKSSFVAFSAGVPAFLAGSFPLAVPGYPPEHRPNRERRKRAEERKWRMAKSVGDQGDQETYYQIRPPHQHKFRAGRVKVRDNRDNT